MNRVDRLMAYLLLFQSRGLMRAQDFATRFEISERTVYRDIQALSEVGVPIVAMPGEGYRLMEGYYLPPIRFTEAEARALSIAVSMLEGLAEDGETKQAAVSALDKIRAVLPKPTLAQIEALQAVMQFAAFARPPLNFDDFTFLQLQEAIHQRRVVSLRYHAMHNNSITERDVEPLNLVFVDRAWLLIGYCRLRQGERNFNLDRIDRLKILAEMFEPKVAETRPPPLGPLQISVRFDPAVLRWVKERQHFSFAGYAEDDSIMYFRVREFREIAHWLLGWGEQMEIVAPAELRHQLAETAAKMLAKHREK